MTCIVIGFNAGKILLIASLLSANERIRMMVPLCKYLDIEMSTTPLFPPPASKITSGFNRDLLEDIMTEIQARLFLYELTPETGWYNF